MKKKLLLILVVALIISAFSVTALAAQGCRHDDKHNSTMEHLTRRAATCEEDGIKSSVYQCTNCQKYFTRKNPNSDFKEIPVKDLSRYVEPKKGHEPGKAVIENEVPATCYAPGSYDEVVYCTRKECKAEVSRVSKPIAQLKHTPGKPVIENEVPATCYAPGSYDEVVYCTRKDCKAEVSRVSKPIAQLKHTPAEPVIENEVPATCYAPGSYDEVVYCEVEECKAELSRTPKSIDKLAHTPAEPVVENEVPATCYAPGSYDEVVYCAVEECKAELSRTPKTIAKKAHTPGEVEIENFVDSTCYAEGSYDEVIYCANEGCFAANEEAAARSAARTELSRVTKTIAKKAHTPGKTVIENEVEATCKKAGSYDEVVYCEVEECKAELSRETKIIPAADHVVKKIPGKAPTCTKPGLTSGKVCKVCKTVLKAQKVIPATGHDWGKGKITVEPTAEKDGVMTFICKNNHKHIKEMPIKYIAPAVDDDYDDVPKTGDNTGIIMATMTGIAMVCAATYVFSKKRSAR